MMTSSIIEVTLKLKYSQRRAGNKWMCTIQGEERCVTSQFVCFSLYEIKEIDGSFNENEVENVSIRMDYQNV